MLFNEKENSKAEAVWSVKNQEVRVLLLLNVQVEMAFLGWIFDIEGNLNKSSGVERSTKI